MNDLTGNVFEEKVKQADNSIVKLSDLFKC